MTCKRILQAGSVTVGHPDAIDAYARELAARGERFTVDYMADEILRLILSGHPVVCCGERLQASAVTSAAEGSE